MSDATYSTAATASPVGEPAATLDELIKAHAEAVLKNEEAWTKAGEIEEDPAMMAAPAPRVQAGRLLRGRDDDGNDIWDPIWAYSAEEIVEKHKPHLEARLSMAGNGAGAEERRAKIQASVGERVKQKQDELAILVAEVKRIEDECGYTAAVEIGRATGDAAKEIESQILAYTPTSLAEAVRLAKWALNENPHEDDENAKEALAAIARAAS